MAITENITWNTSLYDKKHDFVFKYGEYLVQLLTPQEGERILDIGCGTGYLNNLKPGGRLVLEMGGKGNVEKIVHALKKSLINADYKRLRVVAIKEN